MGIRIAMLFLLWASTGYPQQLPGQEIDCYQSRGRKNNPIRTKTLWNGFVVTVAPGSDDVDNGCEITVRDSKGSTVFTGEGFNTALHPQTGRDIDNDGKPDAIVGVDTGGGNRCCWEYSIISFSPEPHVVAKLPPVGFDFTSDGNGKTLIRMTEAFYELGQSLADAPAVETVHQFRSGKLADVTVEFCPSLISSDLDPGSLTLQNLYCGRLEEASRVVRERWPSSEQSGIRAAFRKAVEARWPEIGRRLTNWN